MFSICNTIARGFTILSPMVVEIFPQPIALITLFTVSAGVGSFFIRKPKESRKLKVPEALFNEE